MICTQCGSSNKRMPGRRMITRCASIARMAASILLIFVVAGCIRGSTHLPIRVVPRG